MKKITQRKLGLVMLVISLVIMQWTMLPMTVLAADEPPKIAVNANKNVDVALSVGSTSVDYSAFESQLKDAIGDAIPSANLNVMATTSVDTSTSTNFDWLKFDHSLNNGGATDDFIDTTGNQSGTVYDMLDRHVDLDTTNGTKLTFKGYGSSGYSDFMLLENEQTTNKTFQFDIKEYFAADALYGVGFFFNSNIKYDTSKYTGVNAQYDAYQNMELFLDGYLLALTYNGNSTTGMHVYKVKDLNLYSYHNNNIQIGDNTYFNEIASFPISLDGPYKASDDLRKFRVEVTPTTVMVYYAGFDDETHNVTMVSNENSADQFDLTSAGYTAFASTTYSNLPALSFTLNSDSSKVTEIPLDTTFKSGGSDFGPMVKYGSHGCSRLTKVELSNLTMATDVVRSLNEVVREPDWNEDAAKILVNLNEDPILDFDDEGLTGELLNRLQNDDIYYVGWASDENAAKSEEFLQKNDLKGAIINIDTADTNTMEEQIQKIADVVTKRYEDETGVTSDGDATVVTLGNTVDLTVSGADSSNTVDDTYPQGKWNVKYYDADNTLVSTTTMSNLIPDFSKAGTYEIYYCGTDTSNLIKTIIINESPMADVAVQVEVASSGAISATLTNSSSDLEGSTLTSKWSYLDVTSGSAFVVLNQDENQNALLSMEEGKIYLVSLTVTDKWGAKSTTSKQVSYDPSQSVPPIANFSISVKQFVRNATGESITGSNSITVTDKSYDLYGKKLTSTFSFTTGAAITMVPVSGKDGVYTIDTSTLNAGTYAIYLTVDNGNNTSNRVAHFFTIIKDETGPSAISNRKTGNLTADTSNVKLSFSDNGGSGFEKQKVILSTSKVTPTQEEWDAIPYSYSSTQDISLNELEGTYYIHYQAVDKLGNMETSYIGAYVVDAIAPSIVELLSPVKGEENTAVSPQIKFTMTEAPVKGDGYLYIKNASDDSVVYTIAASNNAVRMNGSTVTINPMVSLPNETQYYISLSKNFLKDSSGNQMSAFDGKGNWEFTTKKATDDIEIKEIKIIGVEVTQTIDDGNGGTEETKSKAKVGTNENTFVINVYDDSDSDATIHVNIMPDYSVKPADNEVLVNAGNGIICKKNVDGSYDVSIPSGIVAAGKTVDITVKNETYTIKFVSLGSNWKKVSSQVVATGIGVTASKINLENAVDVSPVTSTTNDVKIEIKLIANGDVTQISPTDMQALQDNIVGKLKFVDLKILKAVTIDGTPQADQEIHNTLVPIKMRLTLPSELQGGAYDISVYRIHNGVITHLDSELVNNAKEVEFESDEYSTYALKYEQSSMGGAPVAPDSTVNETSIAFENSNPKDVSIPLDKKKKVAAIELNGETLDVASYEVSESEVTIGKERFADLEIGTYTLVVNYSDKSSETFKINVVAYDEADTLTDVPIFYMRKNMSIGNKFALTLTGVKDNASVVYNSSDDTIVTVSSDGLLKAKKNGTATVTITIAQRGSLYKIEMKIKVRKGLAFNRTITKNEAITINTSLPVLNIYKRVSVGNKTKISAKNIASDAVVSYSSDNKDVATISNTGTIKGIAEGECVVTAKIKQGGRTYCYKLLVRVPKTK
ncbi:MAG: Ig-like domain-containing protein [Velocimicrobium sp.]